MSEIQQKLAIVRSVLSEAGLGGIRFRGTDWFAWITGGASNTVLLASESGIAEVLVTKSNAVLLTDAIEAPRLKAESNSANYEIFSYPWQDTQSREAFVRDCSEGKVVASDRPLTTEVPIPEKLVEAKRRLLREEVERYQVLGREAAEAMTEVLSRAQPDWTEWRLTAQGAASLWKRGIEPTLVMAAGADRIPKYRHPMPTDVPIGERAMLVFCGRRHGLYADLTRFVSFRPLSADETQGFADVAYVEHQAFEQSRPGALLSEIYLAIVDAYAKVNRKEEYLKHHQGGTTGYLSREVVATQSTRTSLEAMTALAWNPTVPGCKIEDTIVCTEDGIKILTVDAEWPATMQYGRMRPSTLVVA